MENQKLPNATVVLVMGILSILGSCCYAVPGLLFGVIALVLGNKAVKTYKEAPENYSDYGNVTAGRIMGIIGIILSIIFIALIIWAIMFIGWEVMQDPELLQERLEELQNQ